MPPVPIAEALRLTAVMRDVACEGQGATARWVFSATPEPRAGCVGMVFPAAKRAAGGRCGPGVSPYLPDRGCNTARAGLVPYCFGLTFE